MKRGSCNCITDPREGGNLKERRKEICIPKKFTTFGLMKIMKAALILVLAHYLCQEKTSDLIDFHLKCAITRRLMVNLRQFILSQSTKLIDDFVGQILSKFWNDFHLYVWKNKKGFSSFVGNELALFVGNIPIITQFLMERLVQNMKVLSIIQGLNKWAEIFKFLAITHLGTMTENEYLIEMTKFKANLVEFYEIGGKSFLLDLHGNKSHETFYMHTLRFYLPRICDITYKRHGVGLGIFTMQGFERRNKESKNCMKRFSNMKGNISKNNLKRLYDVFENDTNAY